MRSKALTYKDGKWVSRVAEHEQLSCGYVREERGANGVERDETHLHDACEHGGGARYNWKLIAHLQTYTMLRKRDAALLSTLTSRAKAWQVENKVSNSCFASYAPISVMLAMLMSESELEAAKVLGSRGWLGTQRVFGSGIADVSRHPSWASALESAGWNGFLEHLTASGRGIAAH